MFALASVIDVGAVEALRSHLRSCLLAPAESFDEAILRLPAPDVLLDADPQEWPGLSGPSWLATLVGGSRPPRNSTTPTGFARKYSLLPLSAELGAIRLDLLAAGGDEPHAVAVVLDRALVRGTRLVDYYQTWAAATGVAE